MIKEFFIKNTKMNHSLPTLVFLLTVLFTFGCGSEDDENGMQPMSEVTEGTFQVRVDGELFVATDTDALIDSDNVPSFGGSITANNVTHQFQITILTLSGQEITTGSFNSQGSAPDCFNPDGVCASLVYQRIDGGIPSLFTTLSNSGQLELELNEVDITSNGIVSGTFTGSGSGVFGSSEFTEGAFNLRFR